MAKCILNRLTDKKMDKAAAILKKVYANGDFNAPDAVIGNGILAGASRTTCMGRSGWKFDPDNWCQNYNFTTGECGRNCENDDDCKQMCLQDSSCNTMFQKWLRIVLGLQEKLIFVQKKPHGVIYGIKQNMVSVKLESTITTGTLISRVALQLEVQLVFAERGNGADLLRKRKVRTIKYIDCKNIDSNAVIYNENKKTGTTISANIYRCNQLWLQW